MTDVKYSKLCELKINSNRDENLKILRFITTCSIRVNTKKNYLLPYWSGRDASKQPLNRGKFSKTSRQVRACLLFDEPTERRVSPSQCTHDDATGGVFPPRQSNVEGNHRDRDASTGKVRRIYGAQVLSRVADY